MPRVSKVDLSRLPEDVRAVVSKRGYSKVGEPTWESVSAHCPQQTRHLVELMGSFSRHGTMPKRYIEIAVVAVSRLNACRHCVGRHSVRLGELGLSHETAEKLLETDCPGLDETDRLVRDYAVAVSENSAQMRDSYIEGLKQYFDEAQIVELTWRIAFAGAFNRFNNALQIDLDEGHLAVLLSQDGSAEKLPPSPGNDREVAAG